MLVVETIAKIRRAYFTRGKPIKEICRGLCHVALGRARLIDFRPEFLRGGGLDPSPHRRDAERAVGLG